MLSNLQTPMLILFISILALIVALIFSCSLRRHHQALWQRFGAKLSDLSQYDLAYLMGGPVRVVQLLIAQMVKLGYIIPKKQLFGFSLVLTNKAFADHELEPSEKQFLQHLALRKSISVDDWKKWRAATASLLQSSEARLAILGLKPTKEEVKRARSSVAMPFRLLLALGIFFAFVQFQQDESMVFPTLLIVATWICGKIIIDRMPIITSHGKHLGDQAYQYARERHAEFPVQFACLGVVALAGDDVCKCLVEPFRTMTHQKSKHEAGDGGCGSSCGSSCGSDSGGDSGCGSGCGGCGGGGD